MVGLGEGVSEAPVLSQSVCQGVHNSVKYDHRQGITLEHTNSKMEGLSDPLLGPDNPCEASVQVENNVGKVVRGMVVTKGEVDEFMVHTAIRISNVKQADSLCLSLSLFSKHVTIIIKRYMWE